MNIAGIVVEYNPFHNGHYWHAKETRRLCNADVVIGVMSGQFVQRGEAAFFDKWTRAQMAVSSGVDVVFELPTAYAIRSAQFFATGAVQLLASLGAVSHLCFGAETPEVELLRTAARLADSSAAIAALHAEMKKGHSYARSLGDALQCEESNPLAYHPNNILGIEYIRAIERFAPSILPLAIQRKMAAYHETSLKGHYASATAIRLAIRNNASIEKAMPSSLLSLIEAQRNLGKGPVFQETFTPMLLCLLRQQSCAQLKRCLLGSADGLEYRLKQAATSATDWKSLVDGCMTKRYTRGRLQRALLWILLGVEAELLTQADQYGPQYARLLAFNDTGREALKLLQKTSSIPIIDRPANWLKKTAQKYEPTALRDKMLLLDAKASDIYVLGMPKEKWHMGGCDFKQSPIYHRM
ncbi:nucleotidyltransferase [Azotosporobacter soli]|uniref:nucleotidyltransferase n=1 Tax=Azotosporobacter soli TaxID=3055040 RepID=UPI0031FEC434